MALSKLIQKLKEELDQTQVSEFVGAGLALGAAGLAAGRYARKKLSKAFGKRHAKKLKLKHSAMHGKRKM